MLDNEKLKKIQGELSCLYQFKEEAKNKMLRLHDKHDLKWKQVEIAQAAYDADHSSDNFEILRRLRKELNDIREKYVKAKSDYAKIREEFYSLKEQYDKEKQEIEQLFMPTKFIPDDELLAKAGIPKKYASSAEASIRPSGLIDIYFGEDEDHIHGHNVIDTDGNIRFSRMPERRDDGPIRMTVPKISWTMQPQFLKEVSNE